MDLNMLATILFMTELRSQLLEQFNFKFPKILAHYKMFNILVTKWTFRGKLMIIQPISVVC